MRNNSIKKSLLFVFTFVLIFNSTVFANVLDSWGNENVYRPNPVLFLHGFALGNPASWNEVVNHLNKYFDKYINYTTGLDLSTYYLERINFNDPNGSIDTYSDGREGWADKIKDRVNTILSTYKKISKINLVCHSMGGLAAREFTTNPKYSNSYLNIEKIVTIGTPHAGSPFANMREELVGDVHKIIWEIPSRDRSECTLIMASTDEFIQLLKGVLKIDPSGEAVKDMAVGSLFLRNLNSVPSPSNIKNYAIYGKIGNPFNLMFWYYYRNNAFYSGDKIVPIDSQKGYDIMTEYPNRSYWVWNPEKIVEVNANHFIDELTDQETLNAILSLLDSTKPELEIISPDPNKTTEIYETSIHIQGKVYKEYLPADSTLTINVVRQEDGYISPPQTSLLKPSDLWIPNNPDSVVAEFDELINFPGKGTYKISCQITNPAGLTSDIKDVWIRVLQGEGKIIKVIAKENPHPEPWTDEIVQRELIITSQVYRFDEVNNNWNLIKEIDTSNDLILETNNKYRIDFYNTLIRDDLFLKSFSFKINDDGSLEILDGDGSTYFEQINSGYNIVILFERLAIEILKADNKDVDEYWAYEGEQARNISVITTPATSITTGQPDNPNRGDSVFHRLHVPVQGSLQGETYTNNNIGSISSDVTYFQEGESYFITKLHYSSESEGGGYGGQACVNNGMPYFTAFDVIGTACVVNSYSIVGHITGFGSYDRNISYNENNYYNFNEKIIRDASYLEEGKRRICLGISPVSWNGRMYSPAYSSAPFSTDLLFEADNVVITCAPGKGYVGFDEGVVGE